MGGERNFGEPQAGSSCGARYEGRRDRREMGSNYVTSEDIGSSRGARELNGDSWCLKVWLALFRGPNLLVDVIASQLRERLDWR